jgi:hypothetical protein
MYISHPDSAYVIRKADMLLISFNSITLPFVHFLNQRSSILSELKSATREKIGLALNPLRTPRDLAEADMRESMTSLSPPWIVRTD